MTVLGIASGEIIHIAYIVCGVGALVVESVWALYTIKVLGSLYLMYIGWQSLRARSVHLKGGTPAQKKPLSSLKAFSSGFFTNALNPKAILFFFSVFMVVVSPDTPLPVLIAYGIEMVALCLLWFGLVVLCLSTPKALEFFNRFGKWVERATGGILLGLGAKLALTSLK